jgi:hypothetical protein
VSLDQICIRYASIDRRLKLLFSVHSWNGIEISLADVGIAGAVIGSTVSDLMSGFIFACLKTGGGTMA